MGVSVWVSKVAMEMSMVILQVRRHKQTEYQQDMADGMKHAPLWTRKINTRTNERQSQGSSRKMIQDKSDVNTKLSREPHI